MARNCAFCGKSVGFWEQGTLVCGNTEQTVCGDCRKKYGELPMKERVKYLLDFGQPEEPERLRDYLSTPEERAQKAREAKKSGLTCLRCGGDMLKYGHKLIPVGEEGVLGPVLRDGLLTPWMELDVLRCEKCGRAEFFLPSPPAGGEPGAHRGDGGLPRVRHRAQLPERLPHVCPELGQGEAAGGDQEREGEEAPLGGVTPWTAAV